MGWRAEVAADQEARRDRRPGSPAAAGVGRVGANDRGARMKREIQISHPDKELFPGITKRDLAGYYEQVGRIMVRHVRDRPVAMQAFPNGIGGEGHYMKNRPRHFPAWIPDVRVAKRGGSLRHILIRATAGLVYLARQYVITPHVWMSRADR